MKGSSRMIFIMAMGGSFIQTEIFTSVIGLTGSGLAMAGLLTNLEGFTRANGSTVNLWENDERCDKIAV